MVEEASDVACLLGVHDVDRLVFAVVVPEALVLLSLGPRLHQRLVGREVLPLSLLLV